jgi:hypothetical protein
MTSADIAAAGTEGREAILTALRELRAVGYIVVKKRRDERGRWLTETFVYDDPQPQNQNSDSEVGFPDAGKTEVGFPDSGSLDSGFFDATEKNQQKNQEKEKEKKTRERGAVSSKTVAFGTGPLWFSLTVQSSEAKRGRIPARGA